MSVFRQRSPATGSGAPQVGTGTEGEAREDELTEAEEGIAGERGIPSIHRSRSLQSRLSSVLAMGLMTVLGVGLLTWYYAGAITRQSRAEHVAQSASKSKAQGEMPLPALGHFETPKLAAPPAPNAKPLAEEVLGPPPPLPPAAPMPADTPTRAAAVAVVPSGPPVKSPGELAFERRLQGAVFAKSPGVSGGVPGSGFGAMSEGVTPGAAPAEPRAEAVRAANRGDLSGLLVPSVTPAALAHVLPTRRLLLSKGAFIDCTLETAIDSTLPGMTTCITATDTFSTDGQVVLIERGTKLVGETQGQVQQGAARLFVLWTEARTPTGVVIPLASPGTDEIGRSGVTGEVNRHFWERFGAAILVSIVDGAIQAGVQASSGNNGTVIVNPSATSSVMTEVLKSTVNIAPTITKPQGDRIQVLVARDLDFRSVYELRTAATAASNPVRTP